MTGHGERDRKFVAVIKNLRGPHTQQALLKQKTTKDKSFNNFLRT